MIKKRKYEQKKSKVSSNVDPFWGKMWRVKKLLACIFGQVDKHSGINPNQESAVNNNGWQTHRYQTVVMVVL